MFKPGDVTKDGHKIASIAAQDDDLLVYITDSDQIRYLTVSNAFAAKIDIGIVSNIMSKLKRMLDSCQDEQLKSKLNDRIASALYDALLSESDLAAGGRFTDITTTLKRVVDSHTAKLRIMTMHICLTVLVSGTLGILSYYSTDGREFALSATSGAVGALFSVLTRNSEIVVQPLYFFWNDFLECFSKILAGMIAAILVVLAIKANVILGFASSMFSLLFLSVLAGFSERFVPDFLSSTVKKIAIQSTEIDQTPK